jgi:hypothetical protein
VIVTQSPTSRREFVHKAPRRSNRVDVEHDAARHVFGAVACVDAPPLGQGFRAALTMAAGRYGDARARSISVVPPAEADPRPMKRV